MKNIQVSKCCKAMMTVASSDEGTSHYECGNCGNPCDIYVKPKQKPKSEDWEEEYLYIVQNTIMFDWSDDDREKWELMIKKTISKLLHSQKQSIIEAVEKMKDNPKENRLQWLDPKFEIPIHNQAINDVIHSIKQLK